MQSLQGGDDDDDDDVGKKGRWGIGVTGNAVEPNSQMKTEGLRREVEAQSELTVLFCNCSALTAAPDINTMGERKGALLVRDHLLTEIIFLLALG